MQKQVMWLLSDMSIRSVCLGPHAIHELCNHSTKLVYGGGRKILVYEFIKK